MYNDDRTPAFPIVRQPAADARAPVVVSVPHFGTDPLPHITCDDYAEPWFQTFCYGFADTFAADVYGDLHAHGATVLATPISRMFVDVNRRRDDFEHVDGEVKSRRGVVRTHTMREVAIFARPLALDDVEARLQALYDPYYATLGELLGDITASHGAAVLVDGHTGSPRRMQDHQVVIGTRHDTTCGRALTDAVRETFERHGFEVHENVSGYTGGNIVATFGRTQRDDVHALQIEINAALLIAVSPEELIPMMRRGEIPEKNASNIARLRECLGEIVSALPSALARCAATT